MKKILLILCVVLSLFTFSVTSAEEKLQDVTQGNTIRGITTSSEASGVAKLSWKDGETRMYANFSNLNTPIGDDFYEGWLVTKSPFNMVSTGRLINTDGVYSNFFSSSQDFSSYSYYVVTIEENNENNDPSVEHILEGKVMLVDDVEFVEEEVIADSEGIIVELSEYQKQLVRQIELKLVNVSLLQRMALLQRVRSFQQRLSILDIEESRKTRYAEILEVLVYVLS